MRNEDIEFQIEMLAIQVRQQNISTFYSTMLSVEISVMLSIMVFYAGLYFYLSNPLFGWLVILSIAFVPFIALTWSAYQREMGRFKKELDRLRKKYLLYQG